MSSQVEEMLDLQALNLRDDDASAQGTRAVRFLVQKLQEAQANPALRPTVQALMRGEDVPSPMRLETPREHVSPQGSEDVPRNEGRENSPSQEDSQKRRPSNSMDRSPKRRRSTPSSDSSSSRSGRSERGRFYRSRRRRSPSPPLKREANC